MSIRTLFFVCLCVCSACTTSPVADRFDCPGDVLGDWEIPAAWLDRELTPAQARVEVLSANLSKEACEARWEWLEEQRLGGDRYWLYKRLPDDTLNALGVQRGVVLTRGCTQLGFVTTRIDTEPRQQR